MSALNRMTGVLDNGTTSLATYDYAANDTLTDLTQSFTGSAVTFTYGYNDDDQRSSLDVSDGAYLYHPAAASAVAYTPNSVNQYSAVGSASLTYDGNGNLTGDGVDSFGYDTENHLVAANALGNTIAYAYDPLGRRAGKTVNGTVTDYLSAGDQEIAEYDGSGTLLRRYVYGPGLDEPVATVEVSSGTKAYHHQDGLGSVIALSDGATGSVTDTYAYGPYGQSATLAGSAFRFTGRRLDAESGLYYYRARYYSPALGRFLQTDPIGTRGGINLYAYVENNPLNLTDPFGLDSQWSVGLGGTVAAAYGTGGSAMVGVNVPTNPLNVGGYQLFINLQGNEMVGVGAVATAGLQGAAGTSNGPLPAGLSTSGGWFREVDVCLDLACVGAGWQGSGDGPTSTATQVIPTNTNGGGLAIPVKVGGGIGAYAATWGQFNSVTVATPTIQQVIDSIVGSSSSSGSPDGGRS